MTNKEKLNWNNIDFVYCGDEKPTEENFVSLQPSIWTKPEGGLWTSPSLVGERKSEWQKWKAENFEREEEKQWHIVPNRDVNNPDNNCNILVADETFAKSDCPYCHKIDLPPFVAVDFQKIMKEYDALYVSDEIQKKLKHSVFQGYDVETCIFFRWKFKVYSDQEYHNHKNSGVNAVILNKMCEKTRK